ncbi:hypothetical protein D3C84_1237820 [compost metagenome]
MQLVFRRFCQRFNADGQFADLAAAKRFQGALRVVPLDGVRLLQQLRAVACERVDIHRYRL